MGALLQSKQVSAAAKYIDTWLKFNFRDSRLPGMQVAIRHEDKLLYSRAFGYANLETKEKLTTNHIFRIASHSKTFTAVAAMQLFEQGKLNLDENVSAYLPWFKSSKDKRIAEVTVRQILNHTSGIIRDGEDSDFWQLDFPFLGTKELKEYIATAKLIVEPDEIFKYSNFGYSYLGCVIEAVSGQDYRSYVTEHIVNKLGLKSTGPDLDAKSKKRLAVGYGSDLFHAKRKPLPHSDTQAMSSATGFYSTAEDMCEYFAAHFIGNDSLLSDKAKRQMQHGYWEPKDTDDTYGLGLVGYKKNDWQLFGHSGGFPGFITNTQFDPKRKLVVAVLTNCIDGGAVWITKSILNIIDAFNNDSPASPAKAAKLAKYEGRFYSLWNNADIICTGSKLKSIDPRHWSDFSHAEELSVIDEKTLKLESTSGYSSPGEKVIYNFSKDGTVKTIRYAGTTMTSQKVSVKER